MVQLLAGRFSRARRAAQAALAQERMLAALEAPLVLGPGETALVPSGIAIHLADPQLCAVVLPRSGMSAHKAR